MQRESQSTGQGDRLITFTDPNRANINKADAKPPLPLALIDGRPLTLASFSNFIHNAAHEYQVSPFHNPEQLIKAEPNDQRPFKIIVYNIGAERLCSDGGHGHIPALKKHFPAVPIVLIAHCEEAECIIEAFSLGVQGYMTTALMPTVVMAALKLVLEGGIFAPFETLLLNRNQQKQTPTKAMEESDGPMEFPDTLYFTPRQLEVMEHVKLGEPNKIIASKLGMQECTVKVHVRDVMKKLNATNRTQLVYNAQQQAQPS